MNDYATPMWQKKKARCLERAGYKCEACCAEDVLLHAHHTIYPKGKKVYDVSDASLVCLCENCHARMTKAIDFLRRSTLDYLRYSADMEDENEMLEALIFCMKSFCKSGSSAMMSTIDAQAEAAAVSLIQISAMIGGDEA